MSDLREYYEKAKKHYEWEKGGDWTVYGLKLVSRVLGHECSALSYGQQLSLLTEGFFPIEVTYWNEDGMTGLSHLLSEPDRLKEFLFQEGKEYFESLYRHSKIISADFDLTPMCGKVTYKVTLDE